MILETLDIYRERVARWVGLLFLSLIGFQIDGAIWVYERQVMLE